MGDNKEYTDNRIEQRGLPIEHHDAKTTAEATLVEAEMVMRLQREADALLEHEVRQAVTTMFGTQGHPAGEDEVASNHNLFEGVLFDKEERDKFRNRDGKKRESILSDSAITEAFYDHGRILEEHEETIKQLQEKVKYLEEQLARIQAGLWMSETDEGRYGG